MQKRGWLGQDLAAGLKRRVKNMGRFFCPFTCTYEMSEMVTLAGIFLLGEGQDKESKKAVVLNLLRLC